MSTQAQILANQANSLHSSGPKTEEGKAISSKNNFRHGLTGPDVARFCQPVITEDFSTSANSLGVR